MARPLLIIEFSCGSVRAGIFSSASATAPSYISLPMEGGIREATASVLDALREEAWTDPTSCSIFVGVSPSSVNMRTISVPMDKRDRINEILPFELAGLLCTDIGELIIDNIPLGDCRTIAVAIEKKILAEYLEAFAALGVDPVWIGVTGFSIPSLLHEIYHTQGTKAFINEEFISISSEGRPLFFNAYSGRAGLKLNLSYLEAEGLKIDEVYCTTSQDPVIKHLLPGLPITVAAQPDSIPPEGVSMAALAFEIKKGLLGKTINFRKGEFEHTRERVAVRKKLRLSFALLLVIAGLLLGDGYLRYMTLNNSLATYKGALREEYTKLFPNEKVHVDELYQLSAKLKGIENGAGLVEGRPKVLELMAGLVKAAGKDPTMRIKVLELSIADGKLKATGEAASFNAANRFKELLSQDGLFKSVHISDLKSQGGSGAAFSFMISVA